MLHNTGSPNLRQAQASPEAAREAAFSTYYRSMHWHSGPHVNVWWDSFDELCSLEADGVHCSCYNRHPGQGMLGFECLGDYDKGVDEWDSGLGAQVRDNAVFLCAAIMSQLGLSVTPETLRPHHDCTADHHDCPGNLVDMDDFRRRVVAEQARQRGSATPVVTLPPAPPAAVDHPAVQAIRATAIDAEPHDAKWLQASLNRLGAQPPLEVDGHPGRLTAAAVEAFQLRHGLEVDGLAGPATIAAIEQAITGRKAG